MTMQTINATLSAYAENVRFLDELKKEIETQKAEIIEYMKASGLDTINGSEHIARIQTVTQNRIDTKALQAARPEIAAEFTRETTQQRFTFK